MPFKINSMCGFSLMLAGISVALWSLTHPWGSFAGAEIGRSDQWMVAHTFHFLAGLFGLLGLLGFVNREVATAGTLERAGFVVAFAGTILFAGTGVFTAFLWPVLARDAPQLTELSGPFFSPPHPVIVVTSISYSIGHILLGVGLARARATSMWGAVALVAGAVVLMVPPAPIGPLPWITFPVGGVLFGVGLVALGLTLRRGFRVGQSERGWAPAGA